MRDRPLAFIDVETTGLNPTEHEVIDVAVIREEPNGTASCYAQRVRPVLPIEGAEPDALRINGYSPEAWEGMPTFAEIAPMVEAMLRDAVLVGHNVGFDRAFLHEALRRAGSKARVPHNCVDTVTLAYEHLVPCGLTQLKLPAVRAFLNVEGGPAHTAIADAEVARAVYHALARATVLHRLWWRLRNWVRTRRTRP